MNLFVRGALSNGFAMSVLYGLSSSLQLTKPALIALGLQYGVFLVHGLPQRSEKFYDLSGSLTHLSLVLYALLSCPQPTTRLLVLAILIVIWLTRLGSFLFNRILADGVDTRFDKIKTNPLSFLGAWSLQALWVFLIQLPILVLSQESPSSPSPWDILGLAIWIVGFIFEALADAQKMAFRSQPQNKGRFIKNGLWAYSRHPNYFGEILMWLGICIATQATLKPVLLQPANLHWLSPIFTMFLLLCVSGVPMLERASMKKWGHEQAYLDYVKHTNCIIPGFPAKPKA